jgi:hypothetical protein
MVVYMLFLRIASKDLSTSTISECVKFVLIIISLEINIYVCVKETLTRALYQIKVYCIPD